MININSNDYWTEAIKLLSVMGNFLYVFWILCNLFELIFIRIQKFLVSRRNWGLENVDKTDVIIVKYSN